MPIAISNVRIVLVALRLMDPRGTRAFLLASSFVMTLEDLQLSENNCKKNRWYLRSYGVSLFRISQGHTLLVGVKGDLPSSTFYVC